MKYLKNIFPPLRFPTGWVDSQRSRFTTCEGYQAGGMASSPEPKPLMGTRMRPRSQSSTWSSRDCLAGKATHPIWQHKIEELGRVTAFETSTPVAFKHCWTSKRNHLQRRLNGWLSGIIPGSNWGSNQPFWNFTRPGCLQWSWKSI